MQTNLSHIPDQKKKLKNIKSQTENTKIKYKIYLQRWSSVSSSGMFTVCASPRLRLVQNSTRTSECVFYRTAFSVKTIEILSVLVGIDVYWNPSLLFFLWAMPVRYTLQNGLIWKPKGLRTRHKKPFSKKIIFPGWRTGQSFCPLSSTFCPLSSTSTLNHK